MMQTNYFAPPVLSTMVVFVVEVSFRMCGRFWPPRVHTLPILNGVTRDREVCCLADVAGLVDAAATRAHQPAD